LRILEDCEERRAADAFAPPLPGRARRDVLVRFNFRPRAPAARPPISMTPRFILLLAFSPRDNVWQRSEMSKGDQEGMAGGKQQALKAEVRGSPGK
jgi:hypothetical protein